MPVPPHRPGPPAAGYDFARHAVSEARARKFLVGRDTHPRDVVVRVGDVAIGGPEPVFIAGPCAVDDRKVFLKTVAALAKAGVRLVRANLFKFRTFPESFQGLGEKGLDILKEARERYGVALCSEAIDLAHVEALVDAVDVFQVGARSMMNTALLRALGTTDRAVLLKRHFAATLGEWLAAAEYIAAGGNGRIVLCERGLRTFDPWTRFSLDVPGIALSRKTSPLPVIADISHGLGRKDVAFPVARAALAAGAAGIMVEVHATPSRARSDADQQMTPAEFAALVRGLRRLRTHHRGTPISLVIRS
jgi:3-deoxy-7-phosphoheptulonate synthase